MDSSLARAIVTVWGRGAHFAGVPMSLAKWGCRHDYFASDLRSGVPISRGSPYRSYTGKPTYFYSLDLATIIFYSMKRSKE